MRRSLVLLGLTSSALALGFASSATAQQANGERFREMFLQLDTNGDTVLERDEIPESGRDAFDRLLKRGDTNKNGKLEVEELRGLGQKLSALAETPATALVRFAAMDKDKDDKVSRDEFTGLPANFDRIDANKDGSLAKDEITAFFAAMSRPGASETPKAKAADTSKPEATAKPESKVEPEKPKPRAKPKAKAKANAAAGPLQRFKALDKDGDGKISKAEFPRPAIFERLDADNDGFLTRQELVKFKKPGE